MKNQNDLIGMIVAIVIALAGVLTFFFTKPTPPTPPTPTAVNTADAQLQAGSVTFDSSLPGGGGGSGAGGFGGGPSGFGGGPAGFGAGPGGVAGGRAAAGLGRGGVAPGAFGGR